MKIQAIQEYLTKEKIPLYLVLDYEKHHPLIAELFSKAMLTRKVFLLIPQEGKPILIAHSIDAYYLKQEDGYDIRIYHTYKEMLHLLEEALSPYNDVMVDISKDGLLPTISLLDYGTASYLKDLKKNLISSKDLFAYLQTLNEIEEINMIKSMKFNLLVRDETLEFLRKELKVRQLTEYDVQEFIMSRYKHYQLWTLEPPIVATTRNASNPHYETSKDNPTYIKEGDLLLIDMWTRTLEEDAVFSDITFMSYVGSKVPEKYAKAFSVLRNAIDQGIAYLANNLPSRRVEGYEIDRLLRDYITKEGYGDYFTHRTGHSIRGGDSCHGSGTNIDDYETHDDRALFDGALFSMEPGIYKDDFGMRLETDVYIKNGQPYEVGGHQEEIFTLLSD